MNKPQVGVGREQLDADVDIRAEAESLRQMRLGGAPEPEHGAAAIPTASPPLVHVPLNWASGGHRPNAATRRMLAEAGGRAAIKKFTDQFYQNAFKDPVIDLFLRDHDDPHGQRFANWICEKFGEGTPWTKERASRKTCPFHAKGHTFETPHDRSSAHHAAWHSPKREDARWGQHFKLDDCRIWMRLHFWAMRKAGVVAASPTFAEYYVKFIGHFVSVYERSATQFARDSFRWSADPANIAAYLEAGNQMVPAVVGVSAREAMRGLPAEERTDARSGEWPYEA